jgi:glycosyltransferase involved in cell wall biosynthesis
MVENAPANQYILYHQFGNWINQDTSSGTFIEHPAVQMPFWRMDPEQTREVWRRGGAERNLVGAPEIVQSNSFQVVPTPGAKLVFVAYDMSFWVFPEFTTEANRLNCQHGVLEALERADGFLFISESAKAEFEAILPGWLERNNKPAVAIPLASRLYPNTPIHNSSSGAKISERFWLAVGSIEPRKNHRALFEAVELYWHRSKHPSPLWIAAPEGWRNDEIRTKAAELEAAGMIRMLGYVSEERLAALYGQALALVFPSWYEGF